MPILQPRQKGRTEAFGDLFSGALSGILAGKQLKRKWTQEEQDRAAQDALRIWQMAQADPLLLSTPQAQQSFGRAGYPVPRRGPIEKPTIIQGRDNIYLFYPSTGEMRNTGIPSRQNVLGGLPFDWMKQGEQAPTEQKPNFLNRLFSGTSPATQGLPQTPAPAAPLPSIEDIASQWLEPGSFTGPMPTPETPSILSRLRSAIAGGSFSPTFRGFGAPAATKATPRLPAKKSTPAAPTPTKGGYQLEDYGRPATQEEFERNVTTLARTDRQKAKAYYDRWAELWQ